MIRGFEGGWGIERIWRLLMTAVLYVAFGTGALLVTIIGILPVLLFSRNKTARIRRVRRLNQFAFNSFTSAGQFLGVFNVRFIADHLLDLPGQIIIANHPSLLDVVFLLGRVPNANCVVKKDLLKNLFLGMQVKYAGYILNDAGEELLAQCNQALQRGESLIIFPEGTRTQREADYQFKRGAAYLMLLSEAPVRPVHIVCDPIAMGKHDPWYSVPEKRIDYQLTVLPELELLPLRASDSMGLPLKGRRLTRLLMDWYHSLDQLGATGQVPQPDPGGILNQPRKSIIR